MRVTASGSRSWKPGVNQRGTMVSTTASGPGVEHGGGALAPEVGRRQMGRGRHQDEARGALRMEDGEGLGDHAAERQADDMGLGDVEGVEQAGEVVGEVVDGGRLVARAGAAVALACRSAAGGSGRRAPATTPSHISMVLPSELEKATVGRPFGPTSS